LADAVPPPCPNCGAPAAPGAADCPACGVIFAKWREKAVRAQAEALLEAQKAAAEPGADAAVPLTPRQAIAIPAARRRRFALLARLPWAN